MAIRPPRCRSVGVQCSTYRWSSKDTDGKRVRDRVFENVDGDEAEGVPEGDRGEGGRQRDGSMPDMRDVIDRAADAWERAMDSEGGIWGLGKDDDGGAEWGQAGSPDEQDDDGGWGWGWMGQSADRDATYSGSGPVADSGRVEWSPGDGSRSSDVSVLRQPEKDRVFPVFPSGPQAEFYAPSDISEKVVWWGCAIGAGLIFSKIPLMGALAVLSPVLGPWALAGLRNCEVLSKGWAYSGVWHAQVLEVEPLDMQRGSFTDRQGASWQQRMSDQSMRVLCGDPWKGGARVEMVVPYSQERFSPGEPAELLALSNDKSFTRFKVVREVYLPRLRCWLAEYPFIDRFEFIKILNTLQSESFDRAQGFQGR